MESLTKSSQYDPTSPKQTSARNRQPLNKLLEGTDLLVIKSDEPKILLSMRSRSSTGMPRPHTIVGQRVRQLLQSQELRAEPRAETSTARKRNETPGEYRSRQFSKDTKEDRQRLKQLLGRVNLLQEGEDLCVARPLDTVFEFLSTLSRTENFYRGAFKYVDSTLRTQTIFSKDSFDCQQLKFIIEKTSNSQLVKALYATEGIVVSYREVCSNLARQFVSFINQSQVVKSSYEQYIADLNRTVEQKRETIRKMKETVRYYSFHPSQDLYPYIEQLEQRVAQLKEEIGLSQRLNEQSLSNYEILKATNGILSDKIQQLRAKNYQLELAKYTSTDSADKNSELVDFENHVGSLKSMLDKSLIRMVGMKEEFDKLRQHNESLINERSQLAKRAAVGFSELTPRPDLKKIFAEQGMQFGKIFKPTDRKVSTENFVKTIVGRFKQTFQHLKEFELGKKIVLDSKGLPINKFKQKYEPATILDDLRKNKQKLRATQSAAFNVKNKFNKQIEDKKKLQAASKRD